MMSFCVVPWSTDGVDAVLLRADDVERQQPGRRRVDRHRRVHPVERDAVEQRVHVALVAPPARRPCRPRRAPARGRRRSRSASAGRTRSTARSAPWRGCRGRARWTSPRSSGPRTSASSRACRGSGRRWVMRGLSRIGYDSAPCARSTPGTSGTRRSSAAGRSTACSSTPVRSRPRRRCSRRSTARSRARSCSPTSTSTTPARRARWCGAGPELPVYVHERGAPHMASPERLVASAARLYGGEEGLARLWGEVVPVPEANLHVLARRRDGARRLPRRVHARPRLAPRLLPARADRHRVRRRRRRRADPAVGVRDRADAAARHRRRGVGPLDRPRRGLGPAGARAHPLRPVDDVGAAPRPPSARACTRSSRSPPGTGRRRSPPGIRDRIAQHARRPDRRSTTQAAPAEHLYLGARRYLDKRAARPDAGRRRPSTPCRRRTPAAAVIRDSAAMRGGRRGTSRHLYGRMHARIASRCPAAGGRRQAPYWPVSPSPGPAAASTAAG